MKRICIHWTAGTYALSTADFTHYHYTISKEGTISGGKFRPEDNIPPLRNGKYAAHCGGGNSWCIGVALRGMAGFKNAKSVGKYPLTEKQCESGWALVARLCHEEKIPVTQDTVYTHYEYGKKHPESDSAGKIDIIFLPHQPQLKPDEVGDYIRGKVKWYLDKLK